MDSSLTIPIHQTWGLLEAISTQMPTFKKTLELPPGTGTGSVGKTHKKHAIYMCDSCLKWSLQARKERDRTDKRQERNKCQKK